jgi:hypothetical protein
MILFKLPGKQYISSSYVWMYYSISWERGVWGNAVSPLYYSISWERGGMGFAEGDSVPP